MKKDQDILDLLRQLLDSRDYGNIVSEVRNPSDAELLIEYVLYVRCFVLHIYHRC